MLLALSARFVSQGHVFTHLLLLLILGCSAGSVTAAYFVAQQRQGFRIYSDVLTQSAHEFCDPGWPLLKVCNAPIQGLLAGPESL